MRFRNNPCFDLFRPAPSTITKMKFAGMVNEVDRGKQVCVSVLNKASTQVQAGIKIQTYSDPFKFLP